MCAVLIIVALILVCSFMAYIIYIIKRQNKMIKLLRERNNILSSLNVNASNNIAELKKLLKENVNKLSNLSELVAINSESCKSERFYRECLKRFSFSSKVFILDNAPQIANSLYNTAIEKFLMDKTKISQKEIVVCSLMLLDFSISVIHILCEYSDCSCVYTLLKRLKKKLCLNDSNGNLRQYLKRYANDSLQDTASPENKSNV